ncbi:MAG: zinc ribbon domain-containing protein, partial [Clostridia bacterium]|nr:zinc ribbon domain-containing protein [Clostridia bacterium]
MNCKFCFTENPDDAVFCKACGKRLDGTAVCGSCSKQIPADSAFCPYCGVMQGKTQPSCAPPAAAKAEVVSAQAFEGVKTRKIDFEKIFRYAIPAAALIVALLSLIFVFFIGFK